MPSSADECKSWIVRRAGIINPKSVLDVGPGQGTYHRLLAPSLSRATFDAIEIWEPYVFQYGLRDKYQHVWICDFLDFKPKEGERWDLVILGDVIEHFDEVDAYACWDKAREMAGSSGFVICSTPITPWPQGHEHGNPYEEHKFQFDWHGLRALPGVIESFREGPIGAVVADGR